MDIVQNFIEKAKKKSAKIVYPEGNDSRIIHAASQVLSLGIATPILLGKEDEIKSIASKENVNIDSIKIINPKNSEIIEKYAEIYAESRNVKPGIAIRLVKKPLLFGGMMVKNGDADGMVAGVASSTASVIQSASLTIGFEEGIKTPSSFFVMIVPEFLGEKDKIFLFADCAVNISPTSQQLAEIAVSTGINAQKLLNLDPKIAFLSFSSKGSATHADADKVIDAVSLAKELKPDMNFDGELQVDSAIIPSVAQKKVKDSTIAGNANVLVFPDLDSGNIAYKLVQYLGSAKALGPILQGFAKPVNDMSRGASVEDLIGVTAITTVQTQN